MRILLSTIGSRGDVQPLVGLAQQLKDLGPEVSLCVPPDFREWIEGLGMPVTPIGPELRGTGKASPMATPPTPEQVRQMMEGTVATQFETIGAAAQDCDVIVGATALQIAAPSIAEKMGIPYFFAAFCPAVLPSPHHAPPVLPALGDKPVTMTDYRELWEKDARRWNLQWSDILNAHRTKLGLEPVSDVRSHILTNRPWLASDPTLGPWPNPSPAGQYVFQTGAWILPDDRPLSPELKAFLDAGEPPVYFGFGSIRAPQDLSQVMIQSARALGRRAIISRGWADLSLLDDEPDCLAIGEVNHQSLFKRVAAAVHHGGAGTTHAATRAGAPQVLIPQHYDQYYWAGRVQQLGIGTAHGASTPTADSLTSALEHSLQPEVAARAASIATAVRSDGALIAAQRLMEMIIISKYNPKWVEEFESIKSSLLEILGGLALRIDHIGSTSVPGLGAKDVIDIQITVKELDNQIKRTLVNAGYKYWEAITHDHVPQGENDDPKLWEKFFFNQPEWQRRTNVHLRVDGNPNQIYPLLFRDYLRAHPNSVKSVELIKQEIARRHANDLDAYYDIKDPVYDLIWDAALEWARHTGWKPE